MNFQNNQKKKNSYGFTLVEMLVSVFMFSLVIGGISGLFISAIRSQQHILAHQRLLNQTSYAMEYMSRALRLAKKESAITCLSSAGLNYEIDPSHNNGLKFINHLENDDCQEFFLENNQLKQLKNNLADTVELTSDKLYVDSLNFILSGQAESDLSQPRVTILLKIKGEEARAGDRSLINIQTTISQRNLDVLP